MSSSGRDMAVTSVAEENVTPRSMARSTLAVLRGHPIFCDLAPEALEQLCRYAKHFSLKRGATIFYKGDPGNSLFAVITGTVKISISSADGRSAILNLIGGGELFGEIAVLDGQARTADATANSNCEIFAIDRRDFLPFVAAHPEFLLGQRHVTVKPFTLRPRLRQQEKNKCLNGRFHRQRNWSSAPPSSR